MDFLVTCVKSSNMKNLLILFCFVCAWGSLRAQISSDELMGARIVHDANPDIQLQYNFGIYIDGVNINDPATGVHYITLNLQMQRWWIDYGDDSKRRDMEAREVKDADGKGPTAPTMLGLFNFLRRNGWEFVQSVPPPYLGVETWLFRRIE